MKKIVTRAEWKKMNRGQKNAKIANLLGWNVRYYNSGHIWFAKNPRGKLVGEFDIPNFTEDLNAIHMAEKKLRSEAYRLTYQMYLDQIMGPTRWNLMKATAAERAEAFLMTMQQRQVA